MIDINNWTYGYELEIGDVRRSHELPEGYGEWEYAETDIVNIHGEYAGIACDPMGTNPPVGGEINIHPANSPEELADRIMELLDWFRGQGDQPSASCVNHGHVHIRIPGLRDDIEALKRLTRFIIVHQKNTIEHCYQYKELELMSEAKTARTYLKWDGGRPMPDWMGENIQKATDFEDFIRIQCCGKDGVSRGRPFRYLINTYCLKHIDTIEFRCFRASLNRDQIIGSILYARDFLNSALNDTPWFPWNAKLPPFIYNHTHYMGWENTKWGKERGKKRRQLIEI